MTAPAPPQLDRIRAALGRHGLLLRGGFQPAADDRAPPATATLLLVGNAGKALWPAFGEHAEAGPDALDRWTRRVVEPIAARFGAHAVYPFDGPPHWPFQRWARRAEPVHPTPIGLLIHPDHGLWHAFRAALAFLREIDLPATVATASPCATCVDRPCLTTCPVGAYSDPEGRVGPLRTPAGAAYDPEACLGHLRTPPGGACLNAACLARSACPVGRDHAYAPAQARFHMQAFVRAHGG